ncbi:hypothetical protein D3C83_87920 [compost metagenome]
MHSRCCCPPDRLRPLADSLSLTSSQSAARRRDVSTRCSSSDFPSFSYKRMPKAMFSKIDIGNGVGFWNTMPMRARRRLRSWRGDRMSSPSNFTSPSAR